MLLGCIADDFTGASDLANTLAKGQGSAKGLATMQFVGVPAGSAPDTCEAGVVALKTRSIDRHEAVEQSLAALDWLLAQGAQQILFKYCSTFDSTREGNIGPVAMALADRLGASGVVVCPAFPGAGRTLYNGHLFVGDRLLSESGMRDHPLTPMTDPDIRRWLGHQVDGEVGLVPHATVSRGPVFIRQALDEEIASGRRLVVVDAISDADLIAIGSAAADDPLLTGGSGIGLGLPDNFRLRGLATGSAGGFSPRGGPAVVLSGSCSVASRAQVAAYASDHPAFLVDPAGVVEGDITADLLLEGALPLLDQSPLIFSTAEPEEVAAVQARFGRERVATAVEGLFGDLARRLVEAGVTRIAIGGGETSGAVVSALGVERFHIGPEIDPGVPALAEDSQRGLRLALKSGNFGGSDFYARALRVLEGA